MCGMSPCASRAVDEELLLFSGLATVPRICNTATRSASLKARARFLSRDLRFSAFFKAFVKFFLSSLIFFCSSFMRAIDPVNASDSNKGIVTPACPGDVAAAATATDDELEALPVAELGGAVPGLVGAGVAAADMAGGLVVLGVAAVANWMSFVIDPATAVIHLCDHRHHCRPQTLALAVVLLHDQEKYETYHLWAIANGRGTHATRLSMLEWHDQHVDDHASLTLPSKLWTPNFGCHSNPNLQKP